MMMLTGPGEPEKAWDEFHGILGLYTHLGGDGSATFEFVAFWINPFMDASQQLSRLNDVLKQFKQFFDPFQRYPFLSEPMQPRIESYKGIPYIYGHQEVPGSVDEPLLRGLIWKFLQQFEDVWVHFLDDDYYLSEKPDMVPQWLTPKLSGNRLWINWNRVLAVPADVCSGISLTLFDAVEYIKQYPFKLEILSGLEQVFDLVKIETAVGDIDDRLINILSHFVPLIVDRPWLFCRCTWQTVDAITANEDNNEGLNNQLGDLVKVSIALPNWMKSLEGIERLFYSGWKSLKRQYPKLESLEEEEERYDSIDINSATRDNIMKKLIENGHLKLKVDPRPFKGPEKVLLREEMATERLKAMFEQQEFEEDGRFPDEEDDDTKQEKDKDNEILAQFASEGVLIDEDDFFEYFLRNALHIDEERLEGYRNRREEEDETEDETEEYGRKEYNDDSEYDSDGEEFRRG